MDILGPNYRDEFWGGSNPLAKGGRGEDARLDDIEPSHDGPGRYVFTQVGIHNESIAQPDPKPSIIGDVLVKGIRETLEARGYVLDKVPTAEQMDRGI